MPFKRPTLTELRDSNRSFITSEMGTPPLRNSNIGILSDADAGLAHLHYGYLDWIAKNAVPYTASDEYLAAWAALKRVFRKPATAATSPNVLITGSPGAIVPAGTVLNRTDGYRYRTDSSITISSTGAVSSSITAMLPDPLLDSTGGGEAGNAIAGTLLALDVAIAGVQSQCQLIEPATGGADIESEDNFRTRMLLAYQNTPQGGNNSDYRGWALEVPGVTRAWVSPRAMGAGTVTIYIMCDGNVSGGWPQGTDGASQYEWGVKKATGDQLRVADHIYPLRPVTALVYVASPIKRTIDFVIDGIINASSDTTTAINAAIDAAFFDVTPGGWFLLSDLNINLVSGTSGFVITSPATNVKLNTGELPVRGSVTYT